jgi:hypothetical protein
MLDVTTSHCARCLETKPVSEFYLHHGRPRPYCKRCHLAACAARKKAKRLNGWQAAAAAKARPSSRRDRLEAKRQPSAPIRPLREATGITPLMVTLVERAPNGCKYPYDAPDGSAVSYLFCGLLKVEGKPYCQAHCAIAFRPRDELSPIRLPARR